MTTVAIDNRVSFIASLPSKRWGLLHKFFMDNTRFHSSSRSLWMGGACTSVSNVHMPLQKIDLWNVVIETWKRLQPNFNAPSRNPYALYPYKVTPKYYASYQIAPANGVHSYEVQLKMSEDQNQNSRQRI